MQQMIKLARIAAIILLFCTILCFGLSGFFWNRTRVFLAEAEECQGEIVRMEARRGSEGGTTYSPVFAFLDANKVRHTVHSSMSSYPPAFEVGEKVQILYNPKEPSKARINSFSHLWLIPLILGVCGIGNLLMAVFFLLGVPWVIRLISRDIQKIRNGNKI